MKTILPGWLISCAVGAALAQSTSNLDDYTIRNALIEPDFVLDWNASVSDHFDELSVGSTAHIQVRVYALVHQAMRDAVHAANRDIRVDPANRSAKMAAVTAAHDVALALCPTGQIRFAALHARHIVVFSNVSVVSAGQQIGQRIAASILSNRASDGWPVALAKSTEPTARSGGRRKGGQPTPFVLKRLQDLRPQPPFFAFADGKIQPNRTLQNEKLLGSPADVDRNALAAVAWSTEPVLQWNRVVRSHALQLPQTLPARVKLFASLNTALADALLSATYWAEVYRQNRGDATIWGTLHEADRYIADGDLLPDPSILSWATETLKGFPPTTAVLAGAADSILRSSFDDSVLKNLRLLARQCAWSTLVGGSSTAESCVAGYDLGIRIGAHVKKQEP